MKVILTKDVPNVGKAGQLKNVADGYARNYLIPRGLATTASDKAMKQFENLQVVEKRREARATAAHQVLAKQVGQIELVFKVKVGEQHRLYGSVTGSDVAEALSERLQRPIDKHDIELEEPLKHLGSFKVPVHIGHNLSPEVTVVLQKEE